MDWIKAWVENSEKFTTNTWRRPEGVTVEAFFIHLIGKYGSLKLLFRSCSQSLSPYDLCLFLLRTYGSPQCLFLLLSTILRLLWSIFSLWYLSLHRFKQNLCRSVSLWSLFLIPFAQNIWLSTASLRLLISTIRIPLWHLFVFEELVSHSTYLEHMALQLLRIYVSPRFLSFAALDNAYVFTTSLCHRDTCSSIRLLRIYV